MSSTNIKDAERGGELTAQPLAVPPPNRGDDSDWLRLPKPKQRLWGLSRTTWIELLDSGKVNGITLRKGFARRGIRLVFKPSAEAYLRGLLADDAATKENE